MESFGRSESSLDRLRRERDRLSLAERACVDRYLEDVEPCADALADAARFAGEAAHEMLDAVAESISAFADEIATIVIERHAADAALLPEIVALASVEREGLAEDVRRLRERADVPPRGRLALDALAVSLVAVRRHAPRRAA